MESFGEKLSTKMEVFVKEIKRRNRYFNDNSSLRGVGNVISLEKTALVKRLFWLATLAACAFGTGSVLSGVLQLYTEDVVSYSVETDYLSWDTPFPAVTICETANDNRLKAKFNQKKIPPALLDFGKDIAFWNIRFCKTCQGCKLNVNCIDDYMPLVTIARSSCEDLMTDCWFNDKYFSCCERFKPTVTEYGTCYVFNFNGAMKINRKSKLPTLKFTVLWEVQMKVTSPDEMVSVVTENILGDKSKLLRDSIFEVNLKAEETKSDKAVSAISPSSRDCLFKDDIPKLEKWPFEAYSYGACLVYCRAMEQYRLCNCTHHFMPEIDQIPICNVQGMKCLNEVRNQLLYQNVASCECPMNCDEVGYEVVYSHVILNAGLQGRASQGSVKIGQFPNLRVRRRVDRDMLGLVVDIGGVAGVFFGASILSFIEIVYIFCIRKYR